MKVDKYRCGKGVSFKLLKEIISGYRKKIEQLERAIEWLKSPEGMADRINKINSKYIKAPFEPITIILEVNNKEVISEIVYFDTPLYDWNKVHKCVARLVNDFNQSHQSHIVKLEPFPLSVSTEPITEIRYKGILNL